MIDGRAQPAGESQQSLLDERNVLDRQLDPEVATRDHHAVGGGDHLLGGEHRLGLLDLRHERQACALPHERDVSRGAHEGQRNDVDPDRLTVAQQLEVALRDRRELVGRPGHVESLARGHGPADLDLGVQLALHLPRLAITRRRIEPSAR